MPVAALYDIHGNLPALNAVIDEVRRQGIDRLVIGGDVAAGPMPSATLRRLEALDLGEVVYVRGNADRELVAVRERRRGDLFDPGDDVWRQRSYWAASQLSEDQCNLLRSFPDTAVLTIESLGDVLFCHGGSRAVVLPTVLWGSDRLDPHPQPADGWCHLRIGEAARWPPPA
jgi:predicted phosphodiesterase